MPAVILIYFTVMTVIFAQDWIASGHTTYLSITIAFELLILILLIIFLRKREGIIATHPPP